ncbi:MAG: DUF1476 domain-containing protein [Alphaproteobacteria bacterium]|nr:DUF1476 domain-containing protein [Alphaproteobacteria bacterium]
MSNGFSEREKGFESKFSRDNESEFKTTARRNKLLGLWLADKMGLVGEEAQAYAMEVVKADFEEPGHEDVVRKVMVDIKIHDLDISEHLVRTEMDNLLLVAKKQIEDGV